MRKEQETFTALGIEEDRIIFTGSTEKETLKGYDRYVDLEGMHVFPTLTDSHVHLLYTMILAASSFNLCEVTAGRIVPDSMEGVEASVRDYCRSHPKQKIIAANQYILSAMKEKRLPNRRELDEWTGGRCMIIYNIDGHSSCISTALMKKLGLSCEGHDGRFSGEEHEFMQGKVTNLIAASVTPGVLARGIANFSNLCARYGISRVCAMDGNEDVKMIFLPGCWLLSHPGWILIYACSLSIWIWNARGPSAGFRSIPGQEGVEVGSLMVR